MVTPPRKKTQEYYNAPPFGEDVCVPYAKRVDPDLNIIEVDNGNEDVFLTGRDKILKKYKFPEEHLNRLDPRIKAP